MVDPASTMQASAMTAMSSTQTATYNTTLQTIKAHNMTTNTTIPWHDAELMTSLWLQWVRLENLPTKWSLFVGVAWVALGALTVLLHYPLWQVINTIAIVEAPQTVISGRDGAEKKFDDNDGGDERGRPMVSLQRSATYSLRHALRHVYRIGGLPSFYRGLALNICYDMAAGTTMIVFMFIFYRFIPQKGYAGIATNNVLDLLCQLLLCQWDTAHTHIVVTSPTLRIWYRRLPPFWKTLKAVWLAEVVRAVARHVTFFLPQFLCLKAAMYNGGSYLGVTATGHAAYLRQLVFVVVWLLAQAARLELVIPASVAVIRVQTSLLEEDEDTVVPIDRTFGAGAGGQGGRFAPPGILAREQGAVGFKAAWRSYDGGERRRLLPLYAKFVLVEYVMRAGFWMVLGSQVWPAFWHPEF